MASIRGFRRPLDGTGKLIYYPDTPSSARSRPLVFTFKSKSQGIYGRPAPFAWRLLEPFGKLKYPVLDLVADRYTEIQPPPQYYWGRQPSLSTPFVRIFRPQTLMTVPQEEGPFDADVILGNLDKQYGVKRQGETEWRWGRGGASRDVHRFYIHHLPVGSQSDLRGKPICVVSSLSGAYHAELHVKNLWKPVAYFLQIDDDAKTIRGFEPQIFVFTDTNVTIKNIRQDDRAVHLHVHHFFRGPDAYRHHIPAFANNEVSSSGAWPADQLHLLSPKEIRREFASGYWWRQFVQSAEDLIGLIPVVGDAYDIGSTAYMAATGKAPWTGDRVPRAEAIVYAAAAIGPISVSQVRRFRTWSRGLPGDLAKLSDDALKNPLGQIADPETTLTMAAAASDDAMQQLHRMLKDAQTRKVRAGRFADEFTALLSTTADVSTLEKRFEAMRRYTNIDDVFAGPHTLKQPLDDLYQKYLTRTKHTSDDVTPLEWCRRQTSGSAADQLKKALGPNYSGNLRVLAGSGVAAIRPETFKRALQGLMATNYLDNYKDLHKRTRGMSPVTERDHVFEKRFFLNNPDFSESMDMFESSLAILVPANQAMLTKLRQIEPKLKVWYVHADKRPLMQRLPDGREHEFPLQALWDVHVDTYRQLGVAVTASGKTFGGRVYEELVFNLDYLADDMREQAAILRRSGKVAEADALLKKAQYRKRSDPRDRAFRPERFEQMEPGKEWWLKDDS
jgi:hypothetical protein